MKGWHPKTFTFADERRIADFDPLRKDEALNSELEILKGAKE